jgi:DNA-binding transcriptional MerR regulator
MLPQDMNEAHMHTGIYSISEAARYTGLEESRIRRWLAGYSFKSSGVKRSSPPVWSGQLLPVKGRRAVSFRDLIEMRFVDAFLRAGVSWKTIRDVQELARREFGLDHPFSTNRFRADGSHIVMSAMAEEPAGLFDVSSRQQIFFDAAEPLREELELNEHDHVCRWWPMGRQRSVVLDPARQWGRPLVNSSGVSTHLIHRARLAGLSDDAVAAWLELKTGEVEDATAFESRRAGGGAA